MTKLHIMYTEQNSHNKAPPFQATNVMGYLNRSKRQNAALPEKTVVSDGAQDMAQQHLLPLRDRPTLNTSPHSPIPPPLLRRRVDPYASEARDFTLDPSSYR